MLKKKLRVGGSRSWSTKTNKDRASSGAVISYSDLACHWANCRDLQAHTQPLLFFTVSLPCVFIEAIVEVVWQIGSYIVKKKNAHFMKFCKKKNQMCSDFLFFFFYWGANMDLQIWLRLDPRCQPCNFQKGRNSNQFKKLIPWNGIRDTWSYLCTKQQTSCNLHTVVSKILRKSLQQTWCKR